MINMNINTTPNLLILTLLLNHNVTCSVTKVVMNIRKITIIKNVHPGSTNLFTKKKRKKSDMAYEKICLPLKHC